MSDWAQAHEWYYDILPWLNERRAVRLIHRNAHGSQFKEDVSMKKKFRFPRMNVRLFFVLYFGSFFTMIFSIMDFGVSFWISLAVFGLMAVYGERNKKEITDKIDEIYGNDDEFR